MKKGISAWAFAGRDADECLAIAKQYGYQGIEWALSDVGPVRYDSTEEDIKALREKVESYGLETYSMAWDHCWEYPLSDPDPAIRAKAEECVRKQLQCAAWLGCDTVLVLPGIVKNIRPGFDVVSYATVYDRALEAVKRLAVFAEECGVVIGLENVWSKFLLSPNEMRDFIDKVNSPFVKAYFDIGNVLPVGYPDHWIDILGDRIAKVHIKDYFEKQNRQTHIGLGEVDYKAALGALDRIGYDGWVTAEVFPEEGETNDYILRFNSAAFDRVFSEK